MVHSIDRINNWRAKIALSIFAVTVVWPPVHMLMIRKYDVSPWRLFGWGMYSVPHKARFASIRFVFTEHSSENEPATLKELQTKVEEAPLIGPATEPGAGVIEAYILSGENVVEVPIDLRETVGVGEGRDEILRILEFSSEEAIKGIFARIKPKIPVKIVDGAFIVITRQRLNLAGKRLYTTNKIYYHREEKLRYIGTIPLYKKTLKELIFELKSLSL